MHRTVSLENENRAHHPINSSNSFEVVKRQVSQANLVQKVLLPALDASVHAYRDVALFADGAAEASSLVARGQMGERICKIVKLAACK